MDNIIFYMWIASSVPMVISIYCLIRCLIRDKKSKLYKEILLEHLYISLVSSSMQLALLIAMVLYADVAMTFMNAVFGFLTAFNMSIVNHFRHDKERYG